MTARKSLRAVDPDERAAVRKKLTVVQAAESGSARELLATLRDRVARTVDDPNCPPRDLAALTRRLQEITKERELLDARAAEAHDDHEVADEHLDAAAL